jgi:hypothetical protein
VLAPPRGVLDRKDYNFFRRFVCDVVGDVWIAAYHQFSNAFGRLASAYQRKENKRLE